MRFEEITKKKNREIERGDEVMEHLFPCSTLWKVKAAVCLMRRGNHLIGI